MIPSGVREDAPAAPAAPTAATAAARCPVDPGARGQRCPVDSRAEATVRTILRVQDAPRRAVSDDEVHRTFSIGILLSAFRCLLSYVLLPIITPVLGAATSIGPALGIPVSVVALVFDVIGIRRFWIARHRWRWEMTIVYLAVMGLVTALLVKDIGHFVG